MNNKLIGLFLLSALGCSSAFSQDCNYSSVKGDKFEFAKIFPNGQKYGYMFWRNRPEIVGESLSYPAYVGRKGKLTFEYISFLQEKKQWRKVILENCEIVYFDAKVGNNDNIYLRKELDRALNLVGKSIWVDQGLTAANPLQLYTAEKGTSYPLNDREELAVIDVILDSYGHTFGAGPFFLKVRKKSGEEGLLKYFTAYFFERQPSD